MKFLSLLVVLLVVVGGGLYYIGRNTGSTTVVTTDTGAGVKDGSKVEVTKTDIAENGVSQLPAGFPSDIPVEAANITESFRAAYPSRGVVQYTVGFTSQKTRGDLWDMYADYMNSSGYTVDKSSSSKSLGQISGGKNGSTLSVVVSDHSGLSLVQINYLQR